MGARFGGAIDVAIDFNTGTIGLPALSATDADTAANELRTHLILTVSAAEQSKGMFSVADLLGSGTASDEGAHFIGAVVETISKVHSDVAALLAIEAKPAGLDDTLKTQWSKRDMALETVFKTNSAHDTDPRPFTRALRTPSPRRGLAADGAIVQSRVPCARKPHA